MSALNTCILAVAGFISFIFISGGIHKIEEGNIGIYYRGGALVTGFTNPGYNIMIPMITSYAQIKYQVQSDSVLNIRCSTKENVPLMIKKIEVVNQLTKENVWQTIKAYSTNYDQALIYKRIESELESLCSKMTLVEIVLSKFDQIDELLQQKLQDHLDQYSPGINIISIRVTKPEVPEKFMTIWQNAEMELKQRLIETEKMKVTKVQQDTLRKQAVLNEETEMAVAEVNNQKELYKMQIDQKIQQIYDEMRANKQRALAEANKYEMELRNDINQKRLTSNFLKKQAIEGLQNSRKTYFGQSIPQILDDNMKILL